MTELRTPHVIFFTALPHNMWRCDVCLKVLKDDETGKHGVEELDKWKY